MQSATPRAVVVAVLAVLALSVTAATVQVVDRPAAESGDGAGGEGIAAGQRSVGYTPSDGATAIEAAVLVGLGLVVAAVVLRRAESAVAVGLGGAVTLALLAAAGQLLTGGVSGGGDGGTSGARNVSVAPGGGGSPGLDVFLPVGVLLVGLVVLGGGAAVVVRIRGREDGAGSADDDDGTDVDADAVGRVAGRAAERIRAGESAADNEVYRCWAELTDLLAAPNGAASTPAEFADAAAATGMDTDDVERLRRLFEEVRYGDADPEDREQRAVAVFERIERAYASPGPDGGDDPRSPKRRDDSSDGFEEGSGRE